MTAAENALNWFEISVSDIDRAKKFYEKILDVKLQRMEMGGGIVMEMFPSEEGNGKVSGALCKGPDNKPSADGAKIYLNGNPNLGPILDRVKAAGGQVIMPKTDIGSGIGFMGFFMDTEGNVVGLHSNA
jgi:predicted enzyme related to lactoylglutathione lyase